MPVSAQMKPEPQTAGLQLAEIWPHSEKREAKNYPSVTILLPDGGKAQGILDKPQITAGLSIAEEFFLAARDALSKHPAFGPHVKKEELLAAQLVCVGTKVNLMVESLNSATRVMTITHEPIDMQDFTRRTANILVKHFDNVLRNAGLLGM